MKMICCIAVILFTLNTRSITNALMGTTMRRRFPSGSRGMTIVRESILDQCVEHRVLTEATYSIERRRLIHSLIISSTFKSIASHSADDSYSTSTVLSTTEKNEITSQHDVVINAICDPAVDSYRKGPNIIHIVGTAHISSVSSRLSRDVVKESKVRKRQC